MAPSPPQKLTVQAFKSAASTLTLRDTWLCDIALLRVLQHNFGLSGVLSQDETKALIQFNKAVSCSPEFQSTIDLQFPTNTTGYYRMKMTIQTADGKKQMRHFYFFRDSQKHKGPLKPLTFEMAQKVYNSRDSIRISKRKFGSSIDENKEEFDGINENSSGSNQTSNASEIDGTTITEHNNNSTSSRILPSQILSMTLNFWNSTNAYQLFGVNEENETPQAVLQEYISICKAKASDNIGSVLCLKYLLLRKAYEIAQEKMPATKWKNCCKEAIDIMGAAGMATIGDPLTITRWNRYFRIHRMLEMDHSNDIAKQYHPLLFVCYPESRQLINEYFSNNLHEFSVESFRYYILDELIPKIVKTENEQLNFRLEEDDNDEVVDKEETTKEVVMNAIGLKTLSLSTAHRYINYLGYNYSEQKKCYYNDGHEKEDNVAYRIKFCKEFLKNEVNQYLWITISDAEAKELEERVGNEYPLLKDVYYYFEKDGVPMREYHVDLHPSFVNYVSEENKVYGGNLSIRDRNTRPMILIGQDESSFAQYSFASRTWHGPKGESQLLPKSDGETLMISGFQSRAFGLGRELTVNELAEINLMRRLHRPNYVSEESAMYVYNSIVKPDLTDSSAFVRYFDVGVDKDGYWTFHHIALQFEDLVDCLQVVFPSHDFCCLFDQSSGHAKKRIDGLNVVGMNLKWGGTQRKMRSTLLDKDCFGPFERKLNDGDTQHLVFSEEDDGPFYMKPEEREQRKFDRSKGTKSNKEKTKSELLTELALTMAFQPTKTYTKAQLQAIAQSLQVATNHEVDDIEEGWVGKPKGVLQVLFERGFIDTTRIADYSLDPKTQWKDENNKIFACYLPFCLRHLLSQCSDFRNELTALEDLASKISTDASTVSVMYTPKYHCEIAGDGIEYSWGLAKKYYRSLSLAEKRSKNGFRTCVQKCLSHVTINSTRRFAARTRRYMLAYLYYGVNTQQQNEENPEEVQTTQPVTYSYSLIEKFVKHAKTHRSVLDNDTGEISKVWRESMQLQEVESSSKQ